MELRLNRIYFAKTYTIGRLYVDGRFFCDTLEDTNRDSNKDGDLDDTGEVKVYGSTCIPFGTYEVVVTYSNRFKKQLPLLMNVPEFDGIRIHSGNTDADTLGCILLGINSEKGKVINSRIYADRLTQLLIDEQDMNKRSTIKIF